MIKIFATGRLTKNAEVFTYGDNKTGIRFSIASSNGYDENATFLNCVFWNRGQNLANHLLQGNQVIVEGEMEVNSSQNGQYYTQCRVTNLEFGAKKNSSNSNGYAQQGNQYGQNNVYQNGPIDDEYERRYRGTDPY